MYDFKISAQGLRCFWRRYVKTGSLSQMCLWQKKRKLKPIHFQAIDNLMRKKLESTSADIQCELESVFGVCITVRHGRNIRCKLGWVYRSTKYCQLIRDKNKLGRWIFCLGLLSAEDTLDDCIFSDEYSFQVERQSFQEDRRISAPTRKVLNLQVPFGAL